MAELDEALHLVLHAWPPVCLSEEAFHPNDSWVAAVGLLEDLGPGWFRRDDPLVPHQDVSLESKLVAVLVPDAESLREEALAGPAGAQGFLDLGVGRVLGQLELGEGDSVDVQGSVGGIQGSVDGISMGPLGSLDRFPDPCCIHLSDFSVDSVPSAEGDGAEVGDVGDCFR